MKYSNKERNQLSWARTLPFYCEWHVTDRAAVYNEELFRDACINFADNIFCKDYEDERQRDHLTKLYECILKEMETNLPEYIKEKVADIRVLALGYLTEEVHKALMDYSNEAEIKLEQIEKENYTVYQEALSHLSLEARSALERSFHDSRLLDYGYLDKDIYFLLKMDVGLAPLKDQYLKLIFKDAVVLEGTISKELVCWLQEELYYDGSIKLNIHFSGGDVLIQARDIVSEYCYSFFASDTMLPPLQQEDIVAGKVKNLIEEGKLTLEEAKKHPLCECMGLKAFMNMSILVSGNFDDLAKLTVSVYDDSEKVHALTDKKFIYNINLVNTPEINVEDGSVSWLRGRELLQYISDYCGQEIELWVVWTDCDQPLEVVEYSLTELEETDLRLLYEDNEHGILKSHKIVIRR